VAYAKASSIVPMPDLPVLPSYWYEDWLCYNVIICKPVRVRLGLL
jgi:hypothetical protein